MGFEGLIHASYIYHQLLGLSSKYFIARNLLYSLSQWLRGENENVCPNVGISFDFFFSNAKFVCFLYILIILIDQRYYLL